jgi:hypothetical protein
VIGIHCQANEAGKLHGKREFEKAMKEAILHLGSPVGLIKDWVKTAPHR